MEPADPGADRADGREPVRLPARRGRDHGRGLLPAAGHRHHPGDLRRRAPGQLRLLRLAGARPRLRPQRLRRGPPRRLGVGPAPAGRQRPRRGRQNGSSEDECGDAVAPLRALLPGAPGPPRRAAAARACLRAAEPRPAAPHRRRRRPAGGIENAAAPRPQAHQRPRAPPVHRAARRRAAPRRGAAADHPAGPGAVRAHRRRPRRLPADRCGRSGPSSSAATGWSTSRTRWSASARSGSGPTSRCARGPSPDDVLFLQLKQARRSVVAPYVHGDSAWHDHQGQRVVRVPAGAADGQRPAARLDDGRRAPVLRAPVPRHEGRRRRRRHRRRGAGRLRRRLRAAAREGARPHQRRVDDHRLPRPERQGRRRALPVRAALRRPDRTRPRRARWRPSTAACCPASSGV